MPDNNNFKFKLGVDLDLDSIQSQLEKLNTQNRKINVGINVEDSEFNKVVNDLERSLKRIDTSSVAKSFKSTKDSIMKDINDLTREFSFNDIKTDGFKKATESISKSISTLRDDIRIFKVEQNEMINPNIFNAQKQKALSDYNKLLNSNTASMSKLKTEADMVFKSLNSASTPKELTAANQQLQLLQKNVQTLNSLNLNNLEKEAQQVQDRFSSAIKTLTDLNNLESRLNNISAKSTGSDHLLNQSANLQNRVGSLKDDVYAQADLDGIVDEATINKYKELRDEVNLLNSEFKQYQQTVKQTEKAEKDLSQNNAFELNKAKSLQEIEAYMTNNSKAVQQFGTSLNDLRQRIADVGDQSSLTSLNKEFGILKKQIDAVGASGRTFGAELANDIGKFGTWLGAGTILMSGINGVQNAFQQIVGLDDAMIELRKVTDETEESYRNFYYTANELAKEFGATTQEVIDATATWAQTGYNIQEATQLAQNSIVLSTISEDLSVEESTDALISAMRGFGLEADEVLDGIVSKVNVVGNEFALTNKNVIESLKRDAAALADANNTIDEAIALSVPIVEQTRDADAAGTMLKTMQARIRSVNEETGALDEELVTLAGDLYDLTNVSVYDAATGELRSTYDIIKDIADVYDELDSKTQYQVLDLLGGKRNVNQVAALINNFDTAEQALEAMQNSAGGAMEEFDKATESVSYSLNRLQETMTGIAQNLIDSDAVKFAVDSLNTILNLIDQITAVSGGLGTVLAGVGAYMGAKNTSGFDLLNGLINSAAGTGISPLWGAFLPEEFNTSKLDEFAEMIRTTGMNAQDMASNFGIASTAVSTYVAEVGEANVTTAGLANTIGRSLGGSKVLSVFSTLGSMALNMAAGFAIGTAINAGIKAIDAMITTQAELEEQVLETKNAYNSSVSELDSVNAELAENNAQIAEIQSKGKLTYTDEAELEKLRQANQLLENQKYLLETQVEQNTRQLAIDTVKATNNKYNTNVTDKSITDPQQLIDTYAKTYSSTGGNDTDSFAGVVYSYQQAEKALEGVTKGTEQYQKALDRLSNSRANVNEMMQEINSEMSNMQIYVNQIQDLDPSQWSITDQQIMDRYNELSGYYEYLAEMTEPDQYQAQKFDEIFDTAGLEKTRDELAAMAKEGKLDATTIRSYENLNKAIEDAGFSAEEFNDQFQAMVDNPVNTIERFAAALMELDSNLDDVKEDLEAFDVAFAESVSATGMSDESIDAVASMFSGLDSYDYSALFENTANGIHMNTTELARLSKEYDQVYGSKYEDKVKELRQEYQDLCVEIANTSNAVERNALISKRNSLQTQIDQAEELASKYRGLTSDFSAWQKALSGAEEGDNYDQLTGEIENIEKLYKEGLVGTNEFTSAVQLMTNVDMTTASTEELMKVYEEGMPKIKRYFTEGSDGCLNFLKDVEKLNSEWAHMNEDGSWEINFNDELLSEQLGLNVETIQQIGRKLTDYGFYINFDDSLDELYELQQAASNAEGSLEALTGLDVNIDVSNMSTDEINAELQKLEDKKKEINATPLGVISDEDRQTAFNNINAIESYLQAYLGESASSTYYINIEANRSHLDQNLKDMEDAGIQLGVEIDFDSYDLEYIDKEIAALEKTIENFKDEDGEIDLSIPGAAQAQETLIALNSRKQELTSSAVLDIDVSKLNEKLQSPIQQLQSIQTAIMTVENMKVTPGVDQSEIDAASAKVDQMITDFATKNPTITAQLGIDTTNLETAQTQIDSLTKAQFISIGVNAEAFTDFAESDKDIGASVIYNVDDVMVKAFMERNLDVTADVIYNATLSDQAANFKAPDIKGNIIYTASSVATAIKSAGAANVEGRNNGDSIFKRAKSMAKAFVDGVRNGKKVKAGKSFANGITKGKDLIGELEPEILVRNGQYYIMGEDGAELFDYQPGDIIFNGRQTRELLSKGKITSGNTRGMSFANGNAEGDAFFSGGGTLYENGSVKKYPTGNNKKSSNKSSNDDAEEFLETIDWIEIAIQRVEEEIERLDTAASSVYRSWSERNSKLTSEIGQIRNELSLQQKAYDRYIQEANSVGLSETYAAKVRNGTIDIEDISDEDLYNKIQEYQTWYDKAQESLTALTTLQEDLSEAYSTRFDNAATYWEGKIEQLEYLMDDIETMIDMNEAKGMFSSRTYYDNLIQIERDNLTNLENERNALISAMNEALDSGAVKMYSENWQEMQNEINGVNSAILEANQSLLEFNNSIRELDWEIFDYLQESVSSITDESDFLLDLLGNEKAFDELGKNTQFADARYGLMGINYNTYMEQANQYADALKELDEQFANDPLNMDYLERRNELLESQRDAIKNAEDEKQAIIDLIEEGYNAQLKALNELIQKRKDALDAEKDLFDYQREINEQTQNIANLRKQLAAYETDDSGENQQTLQDLRNQLKDAEEELEESEYERFLSDQNALLSSLSASFEEWISIRLDNQDRLISETIAAVNDNSNNIANTINTATSDVGYTVTNSMKEILNTSTGSITDMISNYDSNFSNKMTTLQSAIDNIKTNVAQMVANANAEAAAQQAQQQQQQANQGSNYGTGGKSPTNSGSSSSSSSSSSPSSSSSSGGSSDYGFFIYKKDYYPKSKLNTNTSIVDRLNIGAPMG